MMYSLLECKDLRFIWQFLETSSTEFQGYWPANQIFSFQSQNFFLKYPIIERKNKLNLSIYEEISQERLDPNLYRNIFPVKTSLRLNQDLEPYLTHKPRLAKEVSLNELNYTIRVPHLHAKPSLNKKWMLMRKMPGQNLWKFIQDAHLSVDTKILLIRGIALALKNQVFDLSIYHNDFHAGNIIVNTNQRNQFEVNIIDYENATGHDEHYRESAEQFLQSKKRDWERLATELIPWILPNKSQTFLIQAALNFAESRNYNIASFINFIAILAPYPGGQSKLEDLFIDLSELNSGLEQELKRGVLTSVEGLNHAVVSIRHQLLEEGRLVPRFFSTWFVSDENERQLVQKTQDFITHLKMKAKLLKNKKLILELHCCSRRLDNLVQDNQQAAWHSYYRNLNTLIQAHASTIDKHCNVKYIFAEFLIVLASLIIFYPLVALVHKVATGHYGFFSTTTSRKKANEIELGILSTGL